MNRTRITFQMTKPFGRSNQEVSLNTFVSQHSVEDVAKTLKEQGALILTDETTGTRYLILPHMLVSVHSVE